MEDGEEEEEAEGQSEGAERCGVERMTGSNNEFRVSLRFLILRWVIGDEPDQNQTEKQPSQVHQSLLFKTTRGHTGHQLFIIISGTRKQAPDLNEGGT